MNDVGGLIGSTTIGFLSDLTYGKRSPVTMASLLLSILIVFILVINYDAITYSKLMLDIFFFGLFFQGVANTIVGACSADMGKGSGNSNERAVATVTGIIDGTGSIGASIGQFMVGAT